MLYMYLYYHFGFRITSLFLIGSLVTVPSLCGMNLIVLLFSEPRKEKVTHLIYKCSFERIGCHSPL